MTQRVKPIGYAFPLSERGWAYACPPCAKRMKWVGHNDVADLIDGNGDVIPCDFCGEDIK